MDLREVDLRGVEDLSGVDLSGANLSGMDLSGANLDRAHLQQANLVDACLDHADLTGVHLWETQRSGWSIKSVICQYAFWDRKGEERIEYGEGEFERIFAEKPRIMLRYPGGMSPIDLVTLPIVVERLQAEYPNSVLQVRSIQNDAGGASVTITVEDRAGRDPEAFATELEALRRAVLTWRAKYQAVMGDVFPMLLERTAAMIKGDTYNIHGQAAAVGPGARAERNTFQQIQGGIDLPKLAEELGLLRGAMKGEATGTREQDKAIGAVADAEEAAAKGDGPATMQYLKSAGKWTLGIAEKIGVAVATEALKRAI